MDQHGAAWAWGHMVDHDDLWAQVVPTRGQIGHAGICVYACMYIYIHICACMYIYSIYVKRCVYIERDLYMYIYMWPYGAILGHVGIYVPLSCHIAPYGHICAPIMPHGDVSRAPLGSPCALR